MRDVFDNALREATRRQDKTRMATLRLISCAIHDRDVEARARGADGVSDEEILGILNKMIRQREESSQVYEEAGHLDMAAQERAEIDIVREFLPRQMGDAELKSACRQVVDQVGANGLRDMGRCMGALKQRYPGQMDFGRASTVVKEILK